MIPLTTPYRFFGIRALFRDKCYLPCIQSIQIDNAIPFENSQFHLDMIHEQLPLPVPCYDLVLVTEFTVVPREVEFRVPPAPLT